MSSALKQGIQAQLEKHSRVEPQWSWAVVFDTTWHPVQPPGGSEWDYDTFITRTAAEEQMRQPLTDRFRNPELWQRQNGTWEEVAGYDAALAVLGAGNDSAPAAPVKEDGGP